MASETLVPLESNPDVMNKLLQKLGVSNKWTIVDVIGLEPEPLCWVTRPVLAVMLLFPITDAYKNYKQIEEDSILAKGQEVSGNIFYMKQTISNACGTVALLHCVANNTDNIEIAEGHLKKFLEDSKGLEPLARGELLMNSPGILDAHKELAQEGQTHTPSGEDPVNHHFVAFVHKDGALYELDGRKAFPINHGPTTADTLLEDAAVVFKKFMGRDPEEVRFTILALSASD